MQAQTVNIPSSRVDVYAAPSDTAGNETSTTLDVAMLQEHGVERSNGERSVQSVLPWSARKRYQRAHSPRQCSVDIHTELTIACTVNVSSIPAHAYPGHANLGQRSCGGQEEQRRQRGQGKEGASGSGSGSPCRHARQEASRDAAVLVRCRRSREVAHRRERASGRSCVGCPSCRATCRTSRAASLQCLPLLIDTELIVH